MKRVCMFCRRQGHESPDEGVTSNGGIHAAPCLCGSTHATCDLCFKSRARILGEFPDQRQMLPECPPRLERRDGTLQTGGSP